MASKGPLAQVVMRAVVKRMAAQGMSGNELASLTGLQQTTIARWMREKDALGPRLNDLQKIARALGTTPQKLVDGDHS